MSGLEVATHEYIIERVEALPPEEKPKPKPKIPRRRRSLVRATPPPRPTVFYGTLGTAIHRGRLELVYDVLSWMEFGLRKPTHIMYHTNLSWNPLMEILQCLIDLGWVESRGASHTIQYLLTDEGREAIRTLKGPAHRLILALRKKRLTG